MVERINWLEAEKYTYLNNDNDKQKYYHNEAVKII